MKRTPAVTSARERARVCGRRWRLPGVWTRYSCPAPDPAPAPAAASTRLRAARLTRLVLPRKSSVEKASGGGGSGSTMAGIVLCIVVIIQMNEPANSPMCLLYKMKHD